MLSDISAEFRNELHPGEHILWSGQPQQGILFRSGDMFFVPFSWLWGGMVILGFTSILLTGQSLVPLLFAMPFILVAGYAMVGRFYVDAKQRAKTFYAVTTERVIILSGLFTRNIRMLNLRMLSEINFNLNKDGKGTIIFGPPHPMAWLHVGGMSASARVLSPTFEMIENARQVYELVQKAQQSQ